MREKYILAIRVLATLLAAELVLVGSFFINTGQTMQKIIPTISIAYGTTSGADPNNNPSTMIDEDLFERQTGEALMDQEITQSTLSPESILETQEGYPPPFETLVEETLENQDNYPPPPFDPQDEWDDHGEDDYILPPINTDEPEPSETPEPSIVPTNPSQPTQQNTLRPTATATLSNPDRPSPLPTTSAGGLISQHVDTAPKLDGKGSDESWQEAPALVVRTRDGVNASASQVTLKTVYNGKRIYFLLTWTDPTRSQLYQPWEKQKDGSWKRITGASNEGGDENEFAEDKIALMWPASQAAVGDFLTQGCAIACHAGENPDTKPFGNKYLPQDDQIADLWVWKSVRNVGQVDDLYLDSTRYADDQRAAGRKSDPLDNGGYSNNGSGDSPEYMLATGEKDGLPGYILDSEKEKLDNNLFQPGDRLPSFITAPFEGDRGDISAGWSYQDGAWTVEISRMLDTGSNVDVQFSDLLKVYYFALATFDNTQVRHATQDGVISLSFKE